MAKKYYLGVVWADGSLMECENLRSFTQATRKRSTIIREDNTLYNPVICTAIAPAIDCFEAKARIRCEAMKIVERLGS